MCIFHPNEVLEYFRGFEVESFQSLAAPSQMQQPGILGFWPGVVYWLHPRRIWARQRIGWQRKSKQNRRGQNPCSLRASEAGMGIRLVQKNENPIKSRGLISRLIKHHFPYSTCQKSGQLPHFRTSSTCEAAALMFSKHAVQSFLWRSLMFEMLVSVFRMTIGAMTGDLDPLDMGFSQNTCGAKFRAPPVTGGPDHILAFAKELCDGSIHPSDMKLGGYLITITVIVVWCTKPSNHILSN